jgi:hypothetical protein
MWLRTLLLILTSRTSYHHRLSFPDVTATKGSLWVNLLSGTWRTFQRTNKALAAPQEAVKALRRAARALVAAKAPRAQRAVLAPHRRR